MKVEVLYLLFLFFFVVLWAFWYRVTTWWYRRKYNPENDKGRKAEDARRELIRSSLEASARQQEIRRRAYAEDAPGRTVVQTASAYPYEPHSKRLRGIFGRFRRT